MKKSEQSPDALDDLRTSRAALARDELRQRRGELVEVKPLKAAAADAIARARAGLQRLPTRLGRRFNLSAADIAVATEMVDAELAALAESFAQIGLGRLRERQ